MCHGFDSSDWPYREVCWIVCTGAGLLRPHTLRTQDLCKNSSKGEHVVDTTTYRADDLLRRELWRDLLFITHNNMISMLRFLGHHLIGAV